MQRQLALARVDLFKDLGSHLIKRLSEEAVIRDFAAGEIIMKEGEEDSGLFIVIHGTVRVTKKDKRDKDVEITEYKDGDILCELAVIDGQACVATITAVTKASCLSLRTGHFNAFLDAHPEAALAILPVVLKRYRDKASTLNQLCP